MSEDGDRLSRITADQETRTVNKTYSRVIKTVRLILPVIAIGLIGLILSWNAFEDNQITPIEPEATAPQATIGKNELLNPKFESTDDEGQPYTIIAKRAIQGDENEDIVVLEKPKGTLTLNDGHVVGGTANLGIFRQDQQKLLLKEDVVLTHDLGYQLDTAELHVDLAANTARSDVDIFGQGPEGTIEAKGLQGSSDTDVLIFQGPAKLVLNLKEDLPGFKGLAP